MHSHPGSSGLLRVDISKPSRVPWVGSSSPSVLIMGESRSARRRDGTAQDGWCLTVYGAIGFTTVALTFTPFLDSVERVLTWSFAESVRLVLRTIGSLAVILAIRPGTIVLIVPTLVLYYRLQKAYRATARETKRLPSITRSPRFAHFKETLLALAARSGAMEAGTAGLVLTYTLQFWGSMNWAIRAFSEAESRMTAVERQ
jgi:hypothetical protein